MYCDHADNVNFMYYAREPLINHASDTKSFE